MTATGPTTCERHGTATALRCGRCETPICPRCSVRTEVGQRCTDCAAGGPTRTIRGPRAARRWPVVVGVAAAVMLIGVAANARAHRNPAASSNDNLTGQGAVTYRSVVNGRADYAMAVPTTWTPAPDNSNTTFSYADTPPSEGSIRVTVGVDDAALSDHVATLVTTLRAQGGRNFAETPETISGLSAIRLDYLFPSSAATGAVLATHTSYLVKRDSSSVISFQLATVDPVGMKAVFEHIEATYQIPR